MIRKYFFVFLFFFTKNISAFEITQPGAYHLERIKNDVALVHTDFVTNKQSYRIFPLEAITTSGPLSNQANIIDGAVPISADHVVFNLSGFNVVGGISIEENQQDVRILNGLIDGLITFTAVTTGFDRSFTTTTVGIRIKSGCKDIYIDDMTVRNAQTGIKFDTVFRGAVRNCELVLNTTGLELNNSHKILVDTTIAYDNKQIGFGLISSTTNCFIECKALSTGVTNTTILNNEVFGFVSTDGYANIFERCIANSTQALSTTDYNSVIAGFALRGSEGCSKIVECESANATTSPSGVTVPYGILLEATLNNPLTFTTNAIGGLVDDPRSSDWSPDGKYVSVANNDIDNVEIYEFNRNASTLTFVTDSIGGTLSSPESAHWSPDGKYISVTSFSNDRVEIYEFNRSAGTLTFVTNATGGLIDRPESANWSPDGKYVMIANGGNDRVEIYEFNRSVGTLTFVTNTTGGMVDDPRSSDWSPDGRYIVVTNDDNDRVEIYEFNRSTLTFVTNATGGSIFLTESAHWSPDGRYIVVSSGGNDRVEIYEFNRSAGTLTFVTNATGGMVDDSRLSDWSPDGRYVLVTNDDNDRVEIYEFNRSEGTLTFVTNATGGSIVRPESAHWSPDGKYISVASSLNNRVEIYDALTFPSKNVIKNNTVYCNSGGSCPSGVGISGSSIQNLIIGNTAYSNPVPQNVEGGGPIVFSNYQFVANIFNPLFEVGPTSIENISIGGCEPIIIPTDIPLLAKQLKHKMCGIESQLDIIESALDNISSCNAASITSPTIIASSGTYCVVNMIAGAIQINASDVELNLNNYRVTGGISVTSGQDQVTIFSGIVENSGGDAIKVNGGSSSITLNALRAQNSQIGINFEGVTGGTIKNCTLTQNTTGLELDNSHKVIINNCVAECNTNAGFCLLSSTTNCLLDCKALSTGEGNTNLTDQTIFGFVSADGYGNIFERCIANSTQALSTTDSNSLIAGFALRGDEGCTKIIECESANAQTNENGVTVPYGILLEATVNIPFTLTTQVTSGLSNPQSSDWSPDGRYVAVANSGTPGSVQIYQFDRAASTLTLVTQVTLSTPVFSDWSPDGRYVAVATGGGSSVQIYQFDRAASTLTFVTQVTLSTPVFSDWSPDGRYIVVGSFIGNSVQIYQFDRVASTLTFVTQVTLGTPVFSDWSPDGRYIAVANGGGNSVQIYQFDRAASTLTFVTQVTSGLNSPESSDWSPDGRYIAVANSGGDSVQIYQFDRAASTLTFVTQVTSGLDSPESSDWSPDGRYVAVANSGTPDSVQIYQFDRAAPSLTFVTQVTSGLDSPESSDWSPDGRYVAVANSGTPDSVQIYDVLSFPSKNVIKNNTVYCNSGGSCPSGVGISGSSIQNLIIGNMAYSNPLPQTEIEGGGPIVFSNYQFVTNVFPAFEQDFGGQIPTALQNISVGGCEPIVTPENEALLAKQFCAKVDELGMCSPTAIIIPTTLSASGNYCLAQDITGDITITTTCVSLDLNHHCLTGEIAVSTADDVEIMNGTVTPPVSGPTDAAITINSTVNRARIHTVSIVCAASTGNGNQGRDGIEVAANDVQIFNCTIIAGDASARTTSGTGARGGHGISLLTDATKTIIQDCVIYSGNGGEASVGASDTGGAGGHGINVESGASGTKIMNTLIFQTGTGGDGGASGTGGAGGDAVKVESGAVDTEVRACRMRNTGAGGGGGTAGADGKAVDDDVTTASDLSIVFANFAHNITSATKFDLQAGGIESGLLTANPPTSGVINPFANVFT